MVRRQANSEGANIHGGAGGAAATAGSNAGTGGTGTDFTLAGGDGAGPLYIGVEAGSDLELQGTRTDYLNSRIGARQIPRVMRQGPRYKVGYLNSADFAKITRNKDPDVIEFYQQRLAAAGLLDSYVPGQMDKATRAAFKELVSQANQTGMSWQSSLQDLELRGGEVKAGGEGRGPLQVELDDPVALRETFQKAVQSVYGGDLPDAEVQGMVDAYRSAQLAKVQAKYDLEGTEMAGTVDAMTDPTNYAIAAVKEKHPQQVDRVKFQDSLSSVMQAFGSGR